MKKGQVKFNNKDAYTEFGVILPNSSVSALMNIPAMKSYITNTGALEDGTQVLSTGSFVPKVAERDLTMVMYLSASSQTQFLSRLEALRSELLKGKIDIWVSQDPNHLHRCIYESSSQFTQFNGKLAKFTLKIKEPNPNNNALA